MKGPATGGRGTSVRRPLGDTTEPRHTGWVGPASLAILVCAGGLKATPLFSWLPVDLTLLSALLVLCAAFDSRVRGGPAPRSVTYPWLVFAGLLGPAALIAPMDTAYGRTKVVTLFTVSLVLAIAPFYLLRHRRQQAVFIWATTLLGTATGSFVALLPSSVANSPGRITLEGSNTIITARMVLAAAVVMIVLATKRDFSIRFRALLASSAIGLTTVAVMTGSRGPAVSLVIALTAVLLTAPAYRAYRGRAIAAVVTLGLIASWYAARSVESSALGRIVSVLTGDEGATPDARVILWSEARDSFLINPFGSGWGSFDSAYDVRYPHNLLAEIAVEAGVVVLLAMGVLIAATLVRSTRSAVDWQAAALQGLLFFSFANALVSSDINGNRLLIVTGFAVWAAPQLAASRRAPQVTVSRSRAVRSEGADPDSHVK